MACGKPVSLQAGTGTQLVLDHSPLCSFPARASRRVLEIFPASHILHTSNSAFAF